MKKQNDNVKFKIFKKFELYYFTFLYVILIFNF
jgi:hypothetical protein